MFWILLGVFSVSFASWLMFHTFSYDAIDSSMRIATKAWSDFGAHIPLIRVFSLGNNWPPEYPLFPGEPIRYHFLFYFLVGMLEKAGLRIDWALNIPSIIGLTGLMIGIAILAQKLFNDKRITVLSVLFFLLNGSGSWVRFFITHPPSMHSLRDIITNTTFPSFAPWGDGDISAFWNLNIYTNQRHLGAAFSLALLFIGILFHMEKLPWKKQKFFLLIEVAILALLPYFHQPILIMLAVFMLCYFVLFPKLRVSLFLIGTLGMFCVLPQLFPLLAGTKTVHFEAGYLMTAPLSVGKAIWYWVQNLGLHFFLIPLGWFLAPPKIKKITLPLFFLFLIPNLFQFAVERAANHKFFNFYLIIGNMLSAYTVIYANTYAWKHTLQRCFARTCALTCGFFLIFSGVIDFFPIANDTHSVVQDIPQNEIATWIQDNTPPDAIFLNSSYIFHPANIAGRKIFMGWPYFSWSAGYNTQNRSDVIKQLFETSNQPTTCNALYSNKINYIMIEYPWALEEITLTNTIFQSHTPIYLNKNVSIYDTETLCGDNTPTANNQ